MIALGQSIIGWIIVWAICVSYKYVQASLCLLMIGWVDVFCLERSNDWLETLD